MPMIGSGRALKPRVGMLTYGLDRPFGGIGRYTVELVRALAPLADRLELALLAAGDTGPLAAGIPRTSLWGCRFLPGYLTVGSAAVALLARRQGFDVVHDPTGVTPFLLGAGPARTVVTLHDVIPWSHPGTSTFLDTLIYRWWLPWALRRVDAIITDSESSKRDICRFLGVPEWRVVVVPLGVSSTYRPASPSEIAAARARYRLPDEYLLVVGSLEERKNLRRLLSACVRLWREGETRPLVVVGARKPGYESSFSALRNPDLTQRVIFTGYVPENDLPGLYSGATIFVFPSRYEGFGLPPLEAMACGTPVVCSDTSSLPEVVGDAAVLVDPSSVEALAGALASVLADAPLRAQLRERGLQRAQRFTWQRAAEETLIVYREVVEGSKSCR